LHLILKCNQLFVSGLDSSQHRFVHQALIIIIIRAFVRCTMSASELNLRRRRVTHVTWAASVPTFRNVLTDGINV